MEPIKLKSGLLVSLKMPITGGVSYERTKPDTIDDMAGNVRIDTWSTRKVTVDPEEHERATKVKGKAAWIIRSVCAQSAFGLLCLNSKKAALDTAIAEARALVDAFNLSAKTVQVGLYYLTGTIATTEEESAEATRAVASEVRDLLNEMQTGIDACDPEAVRKAANKVRLVGQMLDDGTQAKVKGAIEDARDAAREITKRVKKAGEVAAKVLSEISLKKLDEARFAFLDLDAPKAIPAMEPTPERVLDVAAVETTVVPTTVETVNVEASIVPSNVVQIELAPESPEELAQVAAALPPVKPVVIEYEPADDEAKPSVQ